MDLTTYSGLQSAIADFLNRSDLTSQIPGFISLAESKFNRDERLRCRQAIVRAQADLNAQFETLPSDYAEMWNIQLNTQPLTVMEYVPPQVADQWKARHWAPGKPTKFTVVGNTMELVPPPDGTYSAEMLYFGKITPLSSTNTSNWLLQLAPDAYLYGALMESAPYLRDDDRLSMWAASLNAILEQIRVNDQRATYNAGPIMMRAKTFG